MMPEDLKPLPVKGYTDQSNEKVDLVNRIKEMEERLLRAIDALASTMSLPSTGGTVVDAILAAPVIDQRWAAIARTHFQEGFMALNRAVFQPQRIKLPEDGA